MARVDAKEVELKTETEDWGAKAKERLDEMFKEREDALNKREEAMRKKEKELDESWKVLAGREEEMAVRESILTDNRPLAVKQGDLHKFMEGDVEEMTKERAYGFVSIAALSVVQNPADCAKYREVIQEVVNAPHRGDEEKEAERKKEEEEKKRKKVEGPPFPPSPKEESEGRWHSKTLPDLDAKCDNLLGPLC